MLPRTYLFVPGNRPERFAKAVASGADAVVLDLEDAVAPSAKDAARAAIAAWCGDLRPEARGRLVVRINEAGSPEFAEDLRLVRAAGVPTVMLAKAEAGEQVCAVRAACPDAHVLALVETARGVAEAAHLAAAAGVVRLAFGTLDFALNLDLDIDDSADGLSHAASTLALASRNAGLPSPVAGVTPQLEAPERLRSDLAWARRHGFGAKLCIHPAQVAPVHAQLAPTSAAIDWARRVLAAEASSPGAARIDGRMIDRPVVLRARSTLQRAGL